MQFGVQLFSGKGIEVSSRPPYFRAVLVWVLVLAVPALARGGNGGNAVDVCWKRNAATEVWARFQTTGSGIVHEVRYAPEQVHGEFKPKAEFPTEPDEEGWRSWTAHYYAPCDPGTEYQVTDFLVPGTEYWVKLELQE
jgi:hypothetical protein